MAAMTQLEIAIKLQSVVGEILSNHKGNIQPEYQDILDNYIKRSNDIEEYIKLNIILTELKNV